MDLDALLDQYDAGRISRRDLLASLAALAVPAGLRPRAAPAVAAARSLNHVTLLVRDVARSQRFYQELFGMPVVTPQGPGVNLQAGDGFVGLYPAPAGESPRADHFCLGVDRFDAVVLRDRLAARGVEARINQRGETPELYLTDPDGLGVQVQSVRYRGGGGPLGDRIPR